MGGYAALAIFFGIAVSAVRAGPFAQPSKDDSNQTYYTVYPNKDEVEDGTAAQRLRKCAELRKFSSNTEDFECDNDGEVASGSYGSVVIMRKGGVEYAVKRMITDPGPLRQQFRLLTSLQTTRGELHILRELRDNNVPYVVRLEEVYQKRDSVGIYFVMERVVGCTLHQLTFNRNSNVRLDNQSIAAIVAMLAIALEHLDAMHIIHRDIKSDNVIVDYDILRNPNDGNLKIYIRKATLIDFGLAEKLLPENSYHSNTDFGAVRFLAPERCGKHDEICYSTPIDMWALGVLTYMMLTHSTKLPFDHVCGPGCEERHERNYRIGERIRTVKPEFPQDKFSSVEKDLLERMWAKNPESRITPAELLKHEWMARNGIDRKIVAHLRKGRGTKSFLDTLDRWTLVRIVAPKPNLTKEKGRAKSHRNEVKSSKRAKSNRNSGGSASGASSAYDRRAQTKFKISEKDLGRFVVKRPRRRNGSSETDEGIIPRLDEPGTSQERLLPSAAGSSQSHNYADRSSMTESEHDRQEKMELLSELMADNNFKVVPFLIDEHNQPTRYAMEMEAPFRGNFNSSKGSSNIERPRGPIFLSVGQQDSSSSQGGVQSPVSRRSDKAQNRQQPRDLKHMHPDKSNAKPQKGKQTLNQKSNAENDSSYYQTYEGSGYLPVTSTGGNNSPKKVEPHASPIRSVSRQNSTRPGAKAGSPKKFVAKPSENNATKTEIVSSKGPMPVRKADQIAAASSAEASAAPGNRPITRSVVTNIDKSVPLDDYKNESFNFTRLFSATLPRYVTRISNNVGETTRATLKYMNDNVRRSVTKMPANQPKSEASGKSKRHNSIASLD